MTDALLSLAPVLIFLGVLTLLDTYKLVSFRRVAASMAVGAVVAICAYLANVHTLESIGRGGWWYADILLPGVEEILKAAFLVYLIRSHKVGFSIDAAINGFAIGAGFAVAENIYFLRAVAHGSFALWAIRGFGTAMMHGGTTAIVGMMAKASGNGAAAFSWRSLVPGFAVAWAIHCMYNSGLLPPVASAALVLVGIPALIAFIFWRSEQSLRAWIGEKLDSDIETLRMISTGEFLDTPAGGYLLRLRESFTPEVVGDMLCYLQLALELSARAKGEMLLRESGFDVPPDPALDGQFRELAYLERSIGKAGRMALGPLLPQSATDVWEMQRYNRAAAARQG